MNVRSIARTMKIAFFVRYLPWPHERDVFVVSTDQPWNTGMRVYKTVAQTSPTYGHPARHAQGQLYEKVAT